MKLSSKKLIGFCYPTHGFGIPWIMLKFIFKFPVREKCDVFLLNTRAGAKIFKWFAPGVSGIAQILPALVLLAKGFRIRSLFPLDMPSNWISVHPGFKPATVAAIVGRCRAMTDDFCEKVLNARMHFRPNVLYQTPIEAIGRCSCSRPHCSPDGRSGFFDSAKLSSSR